jgi:sec-independent protein translocase protein TatA
MGDLSWWHWLIVVLVFVLLFGSKRLPDAARALGKSMRILKTEVKGLHDDDDAGAAPPTNVAATPALPPPASEPAASEPAATVPTASDSPDTR